MVKNQNLGKRLAIGATFRTTTKRMDKGRYSTTKRQYTYEVLRPGACRHFTKGKRQYYCQVIAIVEMRTGFNCGPVGPCLWIGPRWWQFTYLVKVLEN